MHIVSFPANAISGLVTMWQDKLYHTSKEDILLVGASMGSLRSVAIIQSNLNPEIDYTEILANFMIDLTYHIGDTPQTLTNHLEKLYDILLPEDTIDKILNHPHIHLGIMVTRLKSPFHYLPDLLITIIILLYLLLGIFTPIHLTNLLFDSVCFYTGSNPPPIQSITHKIHFIPFTSDNLRLGLKASARLPILTKQVKLINNSDYYLDGGLINFMCNFKPCPKEDHKLTIIYDSTFQNFPTYLDNIYIFSTKNKNKITSYIPSLIEWFYPSYILNPEKRIQKWRVAYLQKSYKK